MSVPREERRAAVIEEVLAQHRFRGRRCRCGYWVRLTDPPTPYEQYEAHQAERIVARLDASGLLDDEYEQVECPGPVDTPCTADEIGWCPLCLGTGTIFRKVGKGE